MTLRVGIIGLGAVSEPHLSAYKHVKGIKVVAATEPREQRLKEMCALHGFRGYVDYGVMLEREELDIVCVLVPASLHRMVAEACAVANVHIFCEKPIAMLLADASDMVSVCERSRMKISYGASYRFLPAVKKARELINDGTMGEVTLMTESVIGGGGPEGHVPLSFAHCPKGGPGGSGMGLVNHGIHMIDLFPWVANSEIVSVTGRGNISGKTPSTEHVHMQLANGAVGQLLYNDCTYYSDLPAEGIFRHGDAWGFDGHQSAAAWHVTPGCIQIYGTRGSLRIFHYSNQLFLQDKGGLRQIHLPDQPPGVQFGIQMESFIKSIHEDRPVDVTGQDGITALRALLAIYDPRINVKKDH